jgi:hypothetical protein
MNDLDAVMAIEVEDSSEERVVDAFQQLINSGTVWSLQGWYGRAANSLIQRGLCTTRPVIGPSQTTVGEKNFEETI